MITNEVAKGTGRILKKCLPHVNLYDKYTEQGMELPAIAITTPTIYTRRRLSYQKKRIVTVLGTLKIYGREPAEIRDMVDIILMNLNTIPTPDGPLLIHGQDCPYINENSATITYLVTVDMQTAYDEDEVPMMERLTMREEIKH